MAYMGRIIGRKSRIGHPPRLAYCLAQIFHTLTVSQVQLQIHKTQQHIRLAQYNFDRTMGRLHSNGKGTSTEKRLS